MPHDQNTESRVPPFDTDAEAAVLSAIMVDPEAMPKVAPLVRSEAFYSEAHRRIFEAALELFEEQKPIDVVQVATWLRDHDRLPQVGGMPYLTQILNAAPAVANVGAYAKTVARKARTRRLIQTCQRLVAEGYQPLEDEDAFLDRAERLVHEINASRGGHLQAETMREVLKRVFSKMQAAFDRGGAISGISTGFRAVDDASGGLHNGELMVIAGRPGSGKTALAMNIVMNVALAGHGVIVFTLEMPSEQIASRALCSEARVDVRLARTGRFTPEDWRKVTAATETVAKPQHLYLFERHCGLLEMRSMCRALQTEMEKAGVRLGLVVVDYAQLMDRPESSGTREEAVSMNARGCKVLSKEMNCPVIMLSQLNRGVESRDDKHPMLSDMKESGAIEESGDTVIGIYRDEYYNPTTTKKPGIAELLFLKQKHGPICGVELSFHAPSTTFYELGPEVLP